MIDTVIVAPACSRNVKTGKVAATYAPLSTCPSHCPFRGNGCYAENYPARYSVDRCNRAAAGLTALEIAQIEADTIRSMSGKRPLRLHISGDFSDQECAAIIDRACGEYTSRHGQPVWAYTHNWENIDRATFEHISILASVETDDQAARAKKAGYAVARVVSQGKKPKGVIICPAIVKDGVQCVDCKLCFNSNKLRKDIGFWPHGARAKKVENALK